MSQKVRAVYRAGVFVLQEPCDIPDESQVELIVQGPLVLAPEITDPAKRKRLLKAVANRMQKNPLPPTAPYLTREDLHARG